MIIERKFAMGNKYTFLMNPVKELLDKYVKNAKNILIPFAGYFRFDDIIATYIDIEENLPLPYIRGNCIDIMQKMIENNFEKFDLILSDPPYSFFQAIHTYNNKKMQDISACKELYEKLLSKDGIVISFGYNSTGMSQKRGFEKIEVLLINLGGSHNDIIVTVEKRSIKNV